MAYSLKADRQAVARFDKAAAAFSGAVTTWNIGDIGNVLSLGEDAAGELYMLSSNGRVYRISKR